MICIVRYCPKCKEHRQASKKLDLWKLPEILVVHLKRFSYSRYMKNKLDTFVNFPIRNLDLSKYVNPAALEPNPQLYTYELYAVINHYGNLGGGHYSAYAKVQAKRSVLAFTRPLGPYQLIYCCMFQIKKMDLLVPYNDILLSIPP